MDPSAKNQTAVSLRVSLWILAVTWIAVQSLLVYRIGILTGFESAKYIEQANNFIHTGTFSTSNFWLYSVQIFLIAGALKLHLGFGFVIAVQLLFNGIATYYFFRCCSKLTTPLVAFIGTLLLILNFPFQQFNTFLFTESLFYSFIIIFSCFLFQLQKLSPGKFTLTVLFLLLICFTRPTGLLLAPAVFIYLFSRFFHSWPLVIKIMGTLIISLLFIFFLNLAIGSGGELDFLLPFREEHIICGMPTVSSTGGNAGNTVGSIAGYIADHPGKFFQLAWLRSLAFFGLMRSYFSVAHNLYLVLYFFPIYLLAIFSLKYWWNKNRGILFYCLALILLTWGTVMLSCDDWHNRFFLTLMPFIYILSLPMIQRIANLIPNEKSR